LAQVLVATSSMSILTKASSAQPAERAVVEQLQRGEALVQAQCQRLGMRWTILRPTLIYGAGRDRSLTPIARRAVASRLFPLPGGGGLRQPVHADDLAQLVLRALDQPHADGCIVPAGGGERLRAGQMFARVRQALPLATVAVPVPAPVLRLAAACVPAMRGPVSRLHSDLVADNTLASQLLGHAPRDFTLQPWMLGVGPHWQAQLQAHTEGNP
jgi:nucleoside-diphosphate-sugar epimerase